MFVSAAPPTGGGRSAAKPASPAGARGGAGVGVTGAAPPRSLSTSARSRAISTEGETVAGGTAASMSAATRANTAPQPHRPRS